MRDEDYDLRNGLTEIMRGHVEYVAALDQEAWERELVWRAAHAGPVVYHWTGEEWEEEGDRDGEADGLVAPENGCPFCRNRETDELIWREDGASVYCACCGLSYLPGGAR